MEHLKKNVGDARQELSRYTSLVGATPLNLTRFRFSVYRETRGDLFYSSETARLLIPQRVAETTYKPANNLITQQLVHPLD
jgi:hypothetical protein